MITYHENKLSETEHLVLSGLLGITILLIFETWALIKNILYCNSNKSVTVPVSGQGTTVIWFSASGEQSEAGYNHTCSHLQFELLKIKRCY